VLREHGEHDEAEQLRGSTLASALSAARAPTETDEAITTRFETVLATETERVANAAVLAELLAPMIAQKLAQNTPAPLAPAPTVSTAAPAITPVLRPPRPRAASIADFIDEMIAQENPADTPGRGAQRRAS